ncbi:MAG: hypothetical protein K940chlam1_01018 [Candidatus Anoxychlamydiales bacterium]|nr:hypothetical protein [Candidatus Anoxychlamydiales bacterium]NGX35988.1 hypothetical protein [Candidatus Anoxychlamydiales bacterium]
MSFSISNDIKSISLVTFIPKIQVVEKVKKIAKILFNSALFWAPLIGTITFLSIISFYILPNIVTFSISIISSLAFVILLKKKKGDLIYEISILDSRIRECISQKRYPWFNQITENIFLGAIPLKNLNHPKIFKEKKISSILSLVEKKETTKKTILSSPVKLDFWKKNSFNHLHISTKDRYPVSLENLKKVAFFIHRNVKKNKKVYVHCTAGRARSTMSILAYLMKYQKMPLKEAFSLIKSKRSIILLNPSQRKTLVEFAKLLAYLRKNPPKI